MNVHAFTLSGLGERPFSICSPTDPKAVENQCFFCEHCGTTLKNRFFVKSSDGKVSVIGIDCLQKTGDTGLISAVKKLQKEEKNQIRINQQIQNIKKSQAAEREFFSGLTREEFVSDLKRQANDLLGSEAYQDLILSSPVYKALSRSEGTFGGDMNDIALKAKASEYSTRMISIMISIVAKSISGSRKGLKHYNESLDTATTMVYEFLATVNAQAEKIKLIDDKIIEARNKRFIHG